MENLSPIVDPLDEITKAYADNLIVVSGTQPTNSEIWIDTAAPDPVVSLEEAVASLQERVQNLEIILANVLGQALEAKQA